MKTKTKIVLTIPLAVASLLMLTHAAAQDIPKEERKGLAQEAAVSMERVATGFRMAEGPAWDGENLHFSDVPSSKILKLGSDGKVSTIRSDTRWGAGLAFDSKRRLIICEVMGRRVTRVEKDGTEKTLAESYEGKKLNGPNDLAVDAKDGIYFTDPLFMNKDQREQDKEAVYYISPEGKVLRVADDLERPNGIALAGDGKTLFVADTAKSNLRAYPVKEDGTLGEGRDFGSVTGPDGVRVDLDGKIYAAGRTGIAVWDASGKRLGTLKVPVTPNSLAFGDADRRMMYITTPPSVYKIRIDQALKMLSTDEPAAAKEPPAAAPANPEELAQRIQGKIKKLQEGVQKWQNEGKDPSPIGQLMQQFHPLIQDGKVEEAEAVLDKALALLGEQGSKTEEKRPQTSPSSPLSDDPTKRLTEKVERIKEGAHKWAASGRDPSDIVKTMEEKFKPLMEAGKVVEAEAELDRVLEQLKQDGKSTATPFLASNQPTAAEPTGGRIAFPGRDQQGRQQLFTIRIDGTDRRQLTFESNNSMPSWSPDGARLVYVSRTPAPNLTIMDEDGGNKRTLVTGDAPDWGPNGQIAYTSADQTVPTPGRPAEIWVVEAKGGTPRQVTSGGNHGGRVHPSWSPDGKRLVFMQLTLQNPADDDTSNGCPAISVRAELWIIDADGTNARLLTTAGFSNFDARGQRINSASDANAPDWSPAGDVITFWSGQEGCYGQVWRINADGSGRTQLTKAPIPSHNDDPAWSPDGRQILFTTDRNKRIETWVMNADGSNPRFVTESAPGPGPGDAAWQPVRR